MRTRPGRETVGWFLDRDAIRYLLEVLGEEAHHDGGARDMVKELTQLQENMGWGDDCG